MNELFELVAVSALELANRLVVAPMTRSRTYGGLVTELTVEYDTQQAGARLIIAPYNEADPATFYGGDHRGYTDYPVLGS
ncbi:hypothetical protein [Actinoallomurus sp. NPDC050550]|uniref:hypothetical protein n=1 Tax=Actinoallomurus sp. NPDC050550 TaxID=3154937 RepID=UPI0033DF2C76